MTPPRARTRKTSNGRRSTPATTSWRSPTGPARVRRKRRSTRPRAVGLVRRSSTDHQRRAGDCGRGRSRPDVPHAGQRQNGRQRGAERSQQQHHAAHSMAVPVSGSSAARARQLLPARAQRRQRRGTGWLTNGRGVPASRRRARVPGHQRHDVEVLLRRRGQAGRPRRPAGHRRSAALQLHDDVDGLVHLVAQGVERHLDVAHRGQRLEPGQRVAAGCWRAPWRATPRGRCSSPAACRAPRRRGPRRR